MTINLTTENLYLSVIVLLIVLQISQWYFIISLKKHVHGLWSQFAAMALMFYAKESAKDVQAQPKETE
ncbi:MAG: hypothetical protein EBZ49_01275 [Proteobacteria bacterium]|nr:hypothetical protein [Pseudomonadota bacterium]